MAEPLTAEELAHKQAWWGKQPLSPGTRDTKRLLATIDQRDQRIRELVGLLREVQFGGGYGVGECVVCRYHMSHKPGCRVAAALAAAEGEPMGFWAAKQPGQVRR